MLKIMDLALSELLENSSKKLTDEDRIQLFLEHHPKEFSRKNYTMYFKEISSATASRDLKKAVDLGILWKKGDKNTTTYQKK